MVAGIHFQYGSFVSHNCQLIGKEKVFEDKAHFVVHRFLSNLARRLLRCIQNESPPEISYMDE